MAAQVLGWPCRATRDLGQPLAAKGFFFLTEKDLIFPSIWQPWSYVTDVKGPETHVRQIYKVLAIVHNSPCKFPTANSLSEIFEMLWPQKIVWLKK